MALPSNLLVNIRPQTTNAGAHNLQKNTTQVGQQRVVNVINQQVVRPQNNTVKEREKKGLSLDVFLIKFLLI